MKKMFTAVLCLILTLAALPVKAQNLYEFRDGASIVGSFDSSGKLSVTDDIETSGVFIGDGSSLTNIPAPGDNTITTAKLATDAVTSSKIITGAVDGRVLNTSLNMDTFGVVVTGTSGGINLTNTGSAGIQLIDAGTGDMNIGPTIGDFFLNTGGQNVVSGAFTLSGSTLTVTGVDAGGVGLHVVNGISTSDKYYGDGSALTGISAGIGGSGTDNFVPLWNGTSALDDSPMSVSGSVFFLGPLNFNIESREFMSEVVDGTLVLGAGFDNNFMDGGKWQIASGTTFEIDSGAGAGKILTSDAGGVATWETAPDPADGSVTTAKLASDAVTSDKLVFPILGENGSASGPTYSFGTDLDTGMHLASFGQLQFSFGGTPYLQLDGFGAASLGNFTVNSGFTLVVNNLTDYGSKTNAELILLACSGGVGRCKAVSTTNGHVFTATGTVAGQWIDNLTGVGP